GQGNVGIAGDNIDIADVDYTQSLERIDTGGQMGSVSIHRPVVGIADRGRPETSSGTVGSAPVEGDAEDHHIAVAKLVRGCRGDAKERVSGCERYVLSGGKRNFGPSLLIWCVHRPSTLIPDGTRRRLR